LLAFESCQLPGSSLAVPAAPGLLLLLLLLVQANQETVAFDNYL
jgi:hypothetical protein